MDDMITDDANDLLAYINDHVGFLREAIAKNHAVNAEKQAAEIYGWAEELRDLLVRPKK